MSLSAVILLDLSIRISDLEAFYSNTGVLPVTLLFERGWNDYFISFHTISGLWQVQLLLFIAAYFFTILLFIGYRTRLVTFLSWLLLLSLHNRNGFVLQGGDDLLRMVLFWAIFMPWGAKYSCDSILSGSPSQKTTIYSVATIAYLLQICYIYTGSALLKGPEWNHEFTAMYYVYALDQVNYPVTKYFFYYPDLLRKLTIFAYYFELFVPLLFFVPIKHHWFRFTAVLLIVLFHGVNSLTLFIGMFPLIGMATATGLLPTFFLNWCDRRTLKIKHMVRESFLGISRVLESVIQWKEPVFRQHVLIYNIKTAFLIFLTVFVFDWNFSNLSFINTKLSDRLRFIGYCLRLDQNWGMFAPGVFKDDGWFVMEGFTEKNKSLNIWDAEKKLCYTKPINVVKTFKNDRWRKYSENLIMTNQSFLRGYFCNYSKRIWNENHPNEKLKSLKIIYMSEFTLPDYHYSKPEKQVLWECD